VAPDEAGADNAVGPSIVVRGQASPAAASLASPSPGTLWSLRFAPFGPTSRTLGCKPYRQKIMACILGGTEAG